MGERSAIERDAALEAAIDRAGRAAVFLRAAELGWAPTSAYVRVMRARLLEACGLKEVV